jgi:hypothetical protein
MKSLVFVLVILGSVPGITLDERCQSVCQIQGFDLGFWLEKNNKCAYVDLFSPDELGGDALLVSEPHCPLSKTFSSSIL